MQQNYLQQESSGLMIEKDFEEAWKTAEEADYSD